MDKRLIARDEKVGPLDAEGRFKAAMCVLTDFSCHRYLMSCAHGRWDGAEKALRHDELCRLYLCAVFGNSDKDTVRHDLEAEYQAVHGATQELTDNLDTAIGFPLDSRPDYDRLAPLFFERFHDLAMSALSTETSGREQVDGVLIGFMNAGHVHELQQKRIPHGYIYPEEGVGAHVAVFAAHNDTKD